MRAKFNYRGVPAMISLKRFSLFISTVAVALAGAGYVSAQVRAPRPSQKASVMQTIGVTDVTITYSRPGVKGRKIWGEPWAGEGEATLDAANTRPKDAPIVPYGRVWRSGANEATLFVVTDDVLIEGQPLKAGKYSLHTVPGREEWTIIFNSDDGQWGSFAYDAKKDVLRVKTKPQAAAENQEWLLYSIEPVTESSARVNIRWEKLTVPFTVSVKDVAGLTMTKMRESVATAKADDWRTPMQAGNYAVQNKAFDEGMRWIDQSIKIKETFQNLSAKAIALFGAGRKDEAIKIADQAIARGKADKVDTTNFEKRVATLKAGS